MERTLVAKQIRQVPDDRRAVLLEIFHGYVLRVPVNYSGNRTETVIASTDGEIRPIATRH